MGCAAFSQQSQRCRSLSASCNAFRCTREDAFASCGSGELDRYQMDDGHLSLNASFYCTAPQTAELRAEQLCNKNDKKEGVSKSRRW
jgi:hypothetical protein